MIRHQWCRKMNGKAVMKKREVSRTWNHSGKRKLFELTWWKQKQREVGTHSWGRIKSVYRWLWLGASFKQLDKQWSQSSNNSVPEKLETGDHCWTSSPFSEAPESAPAHEELPRLDQDMEFWDKSVTKMGLKKTQTAKSVTFIPFFSCIKTRFPIWVCKEILHLKCISHSICHSRCVFFQVTMRMPCPFNDSWMLPTKRQVKGGNGEGNYFI